MFRALKPGLSKLVFSYSEYMANFIPKRTAAASRGFLVVARLSCSCLLKETHNQHTQKIISVIRVTNFPYNFVMPVLIRESLVFK